MNKEFEVLLQKHTDSSSSEPLDKRLVMIPLSAWEEDSSAELVIRETIRLLFNLGIPIYPNPTTFDPERYLPGREEDKKERLAFLGWGAGELLGDSDNLPY